MALCKSTDESKQILDARKWYFGGRHCRSVTFADDTTGDQSGQYFDLNVIDENYEEKKYYVLLTNGTAVDPAPAGKTKIEVTYSDDDTADVIAGLFVAALSALEIKTDVNAETPQTVEYQNTFLGAVTLEDTANLTDVTYELGAEGFGGFLGSLAEGGSTFSTETEFIDVTADETGGTLLDRIIRSNSASLTAPLVEMSNDNWKALVGKGAGSIYTQGSDEFVGYGTAQVYQSAFSKSAQLTGHPVRKPMSDRTEDITIWKTMPELSDINFSGSEIQTANMTFNGLKDSTKPDEINLWVRGDHSKL